MSSDAEQLAARFETAQEEFERLLESLTDAQWHTVGANHPTRINEEDEGREVGVIAHHVAVSGPFIMARVQAVLEGHPLPPANIQDLNAKHAAEHAGVTRDQVVEELRRNRAQIAAQVRAISDEGLDLTVDTPAGPMSVRQRLERVLIGHLGMHRGSIEAAIAQTPK